MSELSISFKPLSESYFPLLLKWLESPHVKKWWDREVVYTLDLVQEKYSDYVKGYKKINGINKPINSYIIYVDTTPIGYIQIYNAYDFPRGKLLSWLPERLGAFDLFIGEEKYLRQNLGSRVVLKILNLYGSNYSHIFADPDIENISAIKSYEKVGFKKVSEHKDIGEVWMIYEMAQEAEILQELKSREPIFHHPDKFGRTEQDIAAQMCDEFWEVGASGNVYTRQDVISELLKRYNDPDYQDIWEAKDFKLTQVSRDTYLLTYVLIQNKTRITRRSTIWRRTSDGWKILYHQGTIVGGD